MLQGHVPASCPCDMFLVCFSLPSLRGFIARIRRVYNIKLHIARERDKLATHFKKWEKLLAALNT